MLARTLRAAVSPAGLLVGVLFILGVLCTTPILDGDLFWHMAYAKQILARKSLLLDHAAFSWTPASNRTIYCAWASELSLYGLWEVFGRWSVFAFRYMCVFATFALLWRYADRLQLLRHPIAWLACVIWALASSAGYEVKPELFSLLLFNAVVCVYFHAKRLSDRGENPARVFYWIPGLFSVWVNCHGGFILALPFLAVTALGEGLNRVFSPKTGLSDSSYRHLLAAWGLSVFALVLNPYGLRYPIQLFEDYVLLRTSHPDFVWNDAHQSIFAPWAHAYDAIEYLVLMVFILVPLFIKRFRAGHAKGSDWAVMFANLTYAPLYCLYLRTTFYWPAVFAFSALSLSAPLTSPTSEPLGQATPPRSIRRRATLVSAVVCLLLAGQAVLEQLANPPHGGWFGLGIGYVNPVQEAAFLNTARLGPRLYNIFDSGGYLLWSLLPTYRVMTDSRSFPYLAWFEDQRRFTSGELFEDFLARYPADTAVIDLEKEGCWRRFLRAANWRLVFYGPTAAVFVKKTDGGEPASIQNSSGRFRNLRNAQTALQVFRFAATTADFTTAWTVLDQLEHHLKFQVEREQLTLAKNYREAHKALQEREYERAAALFDASLPKLNTGDRDRLIQTLLAARRVLLSEGKVAEADRVEQGLQRLAAPL